MSEVEQNNDSVRLRKTRLLRGIRKMRLERSLLLNELKKRMRKNGTNGYWDEDSEGSSESPPTVCPSFALLLLRSSSLRLEPAYSHMTNHFGRNGAIDVQHLRLRL